ncbi:hypothetical protein Ciccas_004743 [Cichlidogyrus casuarinus]|uniref:Uncharacterized protein n=1 Tax=Cichlidogyrus casuarinus TaxID=1844966 RepID=A0ABD2QE51_9PLAT
MGISNFVSSCSNLVRISLSDNRIGDSKSTRLCETLMNTFSIEEIDLSNNLFTDNSAKAVAELISNSVNLKSLSISRNAFEGDFCKEIGKALPNSSSIKCLNVSWNPLAKQPGYLKFFLQGVTKSTTLEHLDMGYIGLGPVAGLTELALMVKKSISLLELKLNRNPMFSAGCYAILVPLQKNTSSALEKIEFNDIMVNEDFDALREKIEELLERKLDISLDAYVRPSRCLKEKSLEIMSNVEKTKSSSIHEDPSGKLLQYLATHLDDYISFLKSKELDVVPVDLVSQLTKQYCLENEAESTLLACDEMHLEAIFDEGQSLCDLEWVSKTDLFSFYSLLHARLKEQRERQNIL